MSFHIVKFEAHTAPAYLSMMKLYFSTNQLEGQSIVVERVAQVNVIVFKVVKFCFCIRLFECSVEKLQSCIV